MPKYTLQEMSDMHKKGERRVYPKLDVYRLLDTDDFVKRMVSYERAIPASIIKAVLSGLSDTLKRVLSEGYTVKIDELGVFSLSLDFADDKPKVMQEENDKMAYRRVQVKNVNFKVDPQLLKQLQQSRLHAAKNQMTHTGKMSLHIASMETFRQCLTSMLIF